MAFVSTSYTSSEINSIDISEPVGILQMLLSCPKVVVEEYLADISSTVKWVVALQDEEGNWPTKAPSADELRHAKSAGNELVQ